MVTRSKSCRLSFTFSRISQAMLMRTLLLLLAAATPLSAFHVVTLRQQQQRSPTTTELYGLLGRFRNKRKVEQVATIQTGASLPSVDVEKLTANEDGTVKSEVVSIQEVLGTSKAILVGKSGNRRSMVFLHRWRATLTVSNEPLAHFALGRHARRVHHNLFARASTWLHQVSQKVQGFGH